MAGRGGGAKTGGGFVRRRPIDELAGCPTGCGDSVAARRRARAERVNCSASRTFFEGPLPAVPARFFDVFGNAAAAGGADPAVG
jgi:hypothetical protein